MRRAALLAIGLAGCNQVFGLDPPSVRDGGTAIDGPPGLDAADARVDAMPCTGAVTCFPDNGPAVANTACVDEPVSSCADNRFRYCACGDAPTSERTIFVVPSLQNADRSDIILVAEANLANLRVLMDNCWGGPAPQCSLDRGACAGSLRTMYVWSDVPRGPGDYGVTIFADDVGAPCTTADGGRVLVEVNVTR